VKSVLVIGAISNSDREFCLSCDVVLPASYTRIAKPWKAIASATQRSKAATRRLSALRQILQDLHVFSSHRGELIFTLG
jgi:hypothetical protein